MGVYVRKGSFGERPRLVERGRCDERRGQFRRERPPASLKKSARSLGRDASAVTLRLRPCGDEPSTALLELLLHAGKLRIPEVSGDDELWSHPASAINRSPERTDLSGPTSAQEQRNCAYEVTIAPDSMHSPGTGSRKQPPNGRLGR